MIQPPVAVIVERKNIRMLVPAAQGPAFGVFTAELLRNSLWAARQTPVDPHEARPDLLADLQRRGDHWQHLRIERIQHSLNAPGTPITLGPRFHGKTARRPKIVDELHSRRLTSLRA